MLGFERMVLPTNYVKVWAHGFAQQEGRTKAREYLLSWWWLLPTKVASGEVGQQGRSRGQVASGCRGRTPRRNWSRECWTPSGAWPSVVSYLDCGVASGWKRSAKGETSSGCVPTSSKFRKRGVHLESTYTLCVIHIYIYTSAILQPNYSVLTFQYLFNILWSWI